MRAANPHALTGWLLELSAAGGLLAADLSLGAWRHFQVACDLFAQLGLEDPASRPLKARRGAPVVPELPPSRGVGQLIDRETLGELCVLDAFRLADETVGALKVCKAMTLCVLAGSHGLAWEPADVLFVRFLAQALRPTEHQLLIVACGRQDPGLPPDWSVTWSEVPPGSEPATAGDPDSPLSLVPGVITAELRRRLDPKGVQALIHLRGGCFLVPPVLRCGLGTAPSERYDQLGRAASGIAFLASYASYWGTDTAISPSSLWEHVRSVFDAGGFGLAIRLLERAMRAARTPRERAVFELLAQGARIRSGQFEDAARIDEPDQRVAPELGGWLWFTKGWGLTLLEKPSEAEMCLERARDLLGGRGESDEYLYVLNISALNRLKLGDWDGAFEAEQRIRSQLEGIDSGRWQIAYINSLNLARLSRRRGDFEGAERYYREAFSTSYGAWSESDAMHFSVCLARLDEARLRHLDAVRAWARAALYWVSSPVPEAIGSRVMGAVIGSAAPPPSCNLIDQVTVALASHLVANARAAGLPCEPSTLESADRSLPVAFVRSADFAPGQGGSDIWHAHRVAGHLVFGIAAEVAPVLDAEANRRLRALLASLARPAILRADDPIRTIIVDDRLGCGLPESEAGFLAVCLRLGLRAVSIEGRPAKLDRRALEQLELRLCVRLGSIVSRVSQRGDDVVVAFKRYLKPRMLVGTAANLVRLIADGSPAEVRDMLAAAGRNSDLSLLRALERDRIIELFLPEDVSLAAFTGEEDLRPPNCGTL
jgi:tetratricopeptide (TPR) repeat protein